MLKLTNPKVAIPIVLIAGLFWSFGPYVVMHIDQQETVPWQYLFTRGIVIFLLLNMYLFLEEGKDFYKNYFKVGISALIGIQTAIESIKSSINDNFTSMGANTFNIRNKSSFIKINQKGTKGKKYPSITYLEAIKFKNGFPITTSISSRSSSTSTIKYKSKKSNPNINVIGTDENYILTAGYKLAEGRNFTLEEIQQGKHVVIIGEEVKKSIFGSSAPTGKIISIGGNKFKEYLTKKMNTVMNKIEDKFDKKQKKLSNEEKPKKLKKSGKLTS